MGKVSKPTDLGVARPSSTPNVMGPDLAKQPFADFAKDLATRETGFRTGAYDIKNMEPALADIAARTGAKAPIAAGEIPAVQGLANMYAVAKAGSIQREESGTKMIGDLPSYKKAYASYLRWRYPSRYKVKSKGGGTVYQPGRTTPGGAVVPSLGQVSAPPRYGEEEGA